MGTTCSSLYTIGMNTKARGRPRSDPNRDLRTDLLAISRQLLEEGGPAALSMREVARRAGCTHQAPYHYFENREAILAALVMEGFRELGARMQAALTQIPKAGDMRAMLIACGDAYVNFALSQPGVFRIMFRADMCNPASFPEVRQTAESAFGQLQQLSAHVAGERDAGVLSTLLWAHVHGLACLLVDGPLAEIVADDRAREAHLQAVSEHFADGVLAVMQGRRDG